MAMFGFGEWRDSGFVRRKVPSSLSVFFCSQSHGARVARPGLAPGIVQRFRCIVSKGTLAARAESDLPGSSEIGRCTIEVLHTDVLFVGLDNERQCPNSCPIC